MTRRQWAARELEIGENSTEEEARIAYRDLITVWHPDHHASNDRLRRKAERKTQRVILAYEVFTGRDTSSPIPSDPTVQNQHNPTHHIPRPPPTTSEPAGSAWKGNPSAARSATATQDWFRAQQDDQRPKHGRPSARWTAQDILPWVVIVTFIVLLLVIEVMQSLPKEPPNPPIGDHESYLFPGPVQGTQWYPPSTAKLSGEAIRDLAVEIVAGRSGGIRYS